MDYIDFSKLTLGAHPSPEDSRDYKVSMFIPVIDEAFPDEFSITYDPLIYNQGEFGMCVSFSCASIKESQEYRERGVQNRYAPGFIYGNRRISDFQGEGMFPREALKVLTTDGVPLWNDFPIMGTYPTCAKAVEKDKARLLQLAKPQIIKSYVSIQSDVEVKTALMNWGPVLMVVAVRQSFFKPDHGYTPCPGVNEKILGHHAVTIVGWKKFKGQDLFIVNNSWGPAWGDYGKFYLPTDYDGIVELWGVTDYTPVAAVA